MKGVIKYAVINSLGTAAYIVLVVSLIFFFGNKFSGGDETILAPIVILMLFVFSAAFTGALVLGSPIVWYLNGKKREGLSLLFYTLGVFLAISLIAFLFLIIIMSGNVNTLPLVDN